MNVLITGGAGYLGGVVTDLLRDAPHPIRVYDALLFEEAYRKPLDFAYGDIRDRKTLLPHLRWADVVIWLAALVGDSACALDPEVSTAINQDSVQFLAENFDSRIVFLSTCSVYGAQDGVLDESAPVEPLSVYASTKLMAETFLAEKNAVVFRLGTLFGVGDLFSRIRLDLVVNLMAVRACRTGHITVFGGEQYRPLLHVRDAAQAVVDSLEHDRTGVYNLVHENLRILDLADRIQTHFPNLVVERVERMFDDRRNYRVSGDKALRELGFSSRCTVDQGIEELRELVEARRLKNLDNPRYMNDGFLSLFGSHR